MLADRKFEQQPFTKHQLIVQTPETPRKMA